MKLSIIIPYYKTYDLTQRLLEQLYIQPNVEVILIDDGCNEMRFEEWKVMTKYESLKIYHQENHGLAYCRNKGVELATGDYIAYIDSDDMITPDYVEILLNAIKNNPTDIINFNWLDINTNEVYKRPINPAVWKAIYKKDKMIRFQEGHLYGGEDLFFTNEMLDKVNNGELSISYLDRVLYIYNSCREGSYTWQYLHREEQ